MAGTFLHPNTCGFGRVVAFEASGKVTLPKEKGESPAKYTSRLQRQIYEVFTTTFSEVRGNFVIGFDLFRKKLPTLKDAYRKWNSRKREERKLYFETFSSAKWEKLSLARKKEHSFSNCKSCSFRHADIQAIFPVKSRALLGIARLNPVFNAANEVNKLRSTTGRTVKPSQHEVNQAAQAVYNNVATSFENVYKANFAEVISKLPGSKVHYKAKKNSRNQRRKHYRHFKENMENQLEETAFLR